MADSHKHKVIASRRAFAGAMGLLLLAGVAVSCGDSDDQSAQEKYCEAGDSLETSISELLSIDIISVGTNGLEEAIEKVANDVSALLDSADEAAKDDVEALSLAIEETEKALSELGGSISIGSATGLIAAIDSVGNSAIVVHDTLRDC